MLEEELTEEEELDYAILRRDNEHLLRVLRIMDKRIAELEGNDTEYVPVFTCLAGNVSAEMEAPTDCEFIIGYSLKNAVESTVVVELYINGILFFNDTIIINAGQVGDTLTDIMAQLVLTTSDIITIEITSADDITEMDLCVNLICTP